MQTAVSTNAEMLRQAVSDTRAEASEEAQSSEDSGDVKEKASESSQNIPAIPLHTAIILKTAAPSVKTLRETRFFKCSMSGTCTTG